MKILYIMSSFNIYGGTPKKTIDLLNFFKTDSSLYVYSNEYIEYKSYFEETNAKIYEGNYKRNIFLHLQALLKIVDKDNIEVIQTQFPMGEILGGLIKLLRPKIKLIVAFVGSSSPKGIKKILVSKIYNKADAFVYISNYVKEEKMKAFPTLFKKNNYIIYNGTNIQNLKDEESKNEAFKMKSPSILSIAGLTEIKNIDVLINAMEMIIKKGEKAYLYIAGDGPRKEYLQKMIIDKKLEDYIFLLGYRKDTKELLKNSDLFVHSCNIEGFGIAVIEAMFMEKPIIVSNAGALPELIEHNKSGLIVNPFEYKEWANAIIDIIKNKEKSKQLSFQAKVRAENKFSINSFIKNYQLLYEKTTG